MQRVVKNTTPLRLVSTYYILPLFLTYFTYLARLLSFFGKPSRVFNLLQLMRMFSALEVPTLPRTEACTTRQRPDRI
jgi:hypothetical protein